MKAIEILMDKERGRPVDRVNEALRPLNMPWGVAEQFGAWLVSQMPKGERSEDGRLYTKLARNYMFDASLAVSYAAMGAAYQAVRMLALLHIEVVGFGKAGRNAHRAHLRELLRLCRKHVQGERDEVAKVQMSTFYGVLGSA